MTVDGARTSYENEDDPELARRTYEFLQFVLDRGLVDLYVDEDGEFVFSVVEGVEPVETRREIPKEGVCPCEYHWCGRVA